MQSHANESCLVSLTNCDATMVDVSVTFSTDIHNCISAKKRSDIKYKLAWIDNTYKCYAQQLKDFFTATKRFRHNNFFKVVVKNPIISQYKKHRL
jgi:hypothetical protein